MASFEEAMRVGFFSSVQTARSQTSSPVSLRSLGSPVGSWVSTADSFVSSPSASSLTSEASSSSLASDVPINHIQFEGCNFPLYPSDINHTGQGVIDLRFQVEAHERRWSHFDLCASNYVLSVAGMDMEPRRLMSDYLHEIGNLDDYTLEHYPEFQLHVKLHYDNGRVELIEDIHGTTEIWQILNGLIGLDDGRALERNDIRLYYEEILLVNEDAPLRYVFDDDDLTNPDPFKTYMLHAYLKDGEPSEASLDELVSDSDEEPINYITYEDFAFPFQTYKYPLYPSDKKRDWDVLLRDAIYHFRLEEALFDMYEWKYELKVSNFKNGNWDEDTVFELVYLPEVQISAKLEFMEGKRETRKFMVDTRFDILRCAIANNHDGIRSSDLRLLYKGEDVDLSKQLRQVIKDIENPYAFHEVQVMTRLTGGGKRNRCQEAEENARRVAGRLEDGNQFKQPAMSYSDQVWKQSGSFFENAIVKMNRAELEKLTEDYNSSSSSAVEVFMTSIASSFAPYYSLLQKTIDDAKTAQDCLVSALVCSYYREFFGATVAGKLSHQAFEGLMEKRDGRLQVQEEAARLIRERDGDMDDDDL